MSKASGSIDLKSLKIAGEPNKYITMIDGSGIRIHEADAVNTNFAQINSNGMKIYKGGTSDINMIASFGDTVQLGVVDTNKYNILINPTGSIKIRQNTNMINLIDSHGMKIYLPGDQSYPVADFGSPTTIGKVINSHVHIGSTGVNIYQGLGIGYRIASFGKSTIIGKENGSHLTLSSNGFSVYDNAPVEVLSIKPTGETMARQVTKNYYGELIGSYSTAASINKVLTESFTSITNVTLEFTSRYGPTVTRNFTLDTPIGITVYTNSSHSVSTTVNFTVTYNASTQTLTITSGSNSLQSINVSLQTVYGSLDVNGPALYIGAEDTSIVKVDYHSLQMTDKEGNSYFEVSDLRNGEGIASITQTFRGDGTTVQFRLSLTASDTDYTVTVSDSSGGTVSKYANYFEFTSAPTNNVIITASYNTTSSNTKTYTLGWRRSGETLGPYSTAIGNQVTASGYSSLAEGVNTFARGTASHAEGFAAGSGNGSIALGEGAHAEGGSTVARGRAAHSEGLGALANGNYSHAEGTETRANGNSAHTEGAETIADGIYSHAEGYNTHAFSNSHAEGVSTIAGSNTTGTAHAEGEGSEAIGSWSHAQNYYTIATSNYQTAIGRYNKSDSSNTYAFIIGNGNSSTRSNAFEIDWSGNVNIASGAKYKINGTALSASDVGALATSAAYTRSSAGTCDWSNQTDGNAKVIMKSALAYWNGAYSGTSSNLAYCNKGAFGTLATKNSLSASDVGAVPKSICCFANSVVRTPSSGTITFTLSELGITNGAKPVGILMTYQNGGASPTILRYDYDASSNSSVVIKAYDVNGNAVSSTVRFFMMVFQGSWTS